MSDTWKPCSSCKKPIPWGGRWFRCSVSTCNSGRFQLAFCSVGCWDAHNPSMNHRSGVWAIEERAPARPSASGTTPAAAAAGAAVPAEAARRLVRGPSAPAEPEEVLIIASRLKDYIRDRADMNTSADVLEALSDLVREASLDAIEHARSEGRKTVMARDFRRR